MDPANQNRQTGRTTRQLDEVIEMTEGPQRVLYLLPTESSIPYGMNLLIIRLKNIKPRREFYCRGELSIVFPNNASLVHFSWINQMPDRLLAQYARGSVVLDHACIDTYPKATARWLDLCQLNAIEHKRPY